MDELFETIRTVTPKFNKEQDNDRYPYDKNPNASLDILKDTGYTLDEIDLIDTVNEMTDSLAQTVQGVVNEEMEKQNISPKIRNYVKEKRLNSPSFKLRFGEKAAEMLEDARLGYQANSDEIIREGKAVLVFSLPKPLSQYFWKGKGSWGKGVDTKQNVIEWGKIYREVMTNVWEERDSSEKRYNLKLARINDDYEHDPDKYYYVWKIEPGSTV